MNESTLASAGAAHRDSNVTHKRRKINCIFPLATLACALVASSIARADAPALRWRIVATHPHDTASFTQGLVMADGVLWESTGLHGASSVSRIDLSSGRAVWRHRLGAEQFGEGLAMARGALVQLTWRSGIAFRYTTRLREAGTFSYAGEGWGLTWDGREFLMSDGSPRVVRRDARTFEVTSAFTVRDGSSAVAQLNELEWAGGWLYANVWHSDRIAVIDPAAGAVHAWLDLSALRQRFKLPPGWDEAEHVLNGIAYDVRSGHFLVTGKCWPALFELEWTPPRH